MATPNIKNPTDFANALLGALGVPDSKTNVQNLLGWYAHEGGNWDNTAKFNPYNTSQQERGSVNYQTGRPGTGVQSYTDWGQGIDATVQTLDYADYASVLNDLSTSAPWNKFAKDLEDSPWDAGHYGYALTGSTPPSGAATNKNQYKGGEADTINAGAQDNQPSNSPNKQDLTGLAGVLQTLDSMYNPGLEGPSLTNPLSWIGFIPKDIEHVSIMIFTRTTSAVLMVGLIGIGVVTLLHGSGGIGGGSGGPVNVLEFVNNAQVGNRRQAASEERLAAGREKEAHVSRRHEERLRDNAATRTSRERVAATPRVGLRYSESHVYHHKEPATKRVDYEM